VGGRGLLIFHCVQIARNSTANEIIATENGDQGGTGSKRADRSPSSSVLKQLYCAMATKVSVQVQVSRLVRFRTADSVSVQPGILRWVVMLGLAAVKSISCTASGDGPEYAIAVA